MSLPQRASPCPCLPWRKRLLKARLTLRRANQRGSLLSFTVDDGGKYDAMTYWEQIDNGVENTGNRKFLRIVPIILFMASYRQVGSARRVRVVMCVRAYVCMPARRGVRVRFICTITVSVQFQCQRACVLADNRSSVIHQHGVYLARPAAENPDRPQQGNAALRKLRGALHTGWWSQSTAQVSVAWVSVLVGAWAAL